jgi:hypothetical protein
MTASRIRSSNSGCDRPQREPIDGARLGFANLLFRRGHPGGRRTVVRRARRGPARGRFPGPAAAAQLQQQPQPAQRAGAALPQIHRPRRRRAGRPRDRPHHGRMDRPAQRHPRRRSHASRGRSSACPSCTPTACGCTTQTGTGSAAGTWKRCREAPALFVLLLALLAGLLGMAPAFAIPQVVLVQNSGWMEPFYTDPQSPSSRW